LGMVGLPFLRHSFAVHNLWSVRSFGCKNVEVPSIYFRDRTLDRICQRCCLGKSGRRSSISFPTLVAFGAASICSTGFGQDLAPQASLWRRMEKIHICPIDEFRTCQYRSNSLCRRSLLKAAVASGYDRRGIYQHRQKLHGFCFRGC